MCRLTEDLCRAKMPAEDRPMTGSRARLRIALRASMAVLAVVLLARCTDTVHGSADANGSDRGSAGIIRLNLPL